MTYHVIHLAWLAPCERANGIAWGELRHPQFVFHYRFDLDYFTTDWVQTAENLALRLIHDIFGNPFRPVAFDPAWRTGTAVALAKGMYESRDFFAMPILADALQDAGCDRADILNHCRDANQVHVRGCWVVDLVLGKE
jgi:hypothetical protein